jgi:hypothetical protein
MHTALADNIAAIATHIDAVRSIGRYGVGSVEQMFTGFQAIRGPGPKPWREGLGIRPDNTQLTAQFIHQRRQELARRHHPDTGGDPRVMAEINDGADLSLPEIVE